MLVDDKVFAVSTLERDLVVLDMVDVSSATVEVEAEMHSPQWFSIAWPLCGMHLG